jgi:DNA-binding winged helix-turn-helix (wHTH) protein/TolB-like protein/Tfp pilus assembly protein PilF
MVKLSDTYYEFGPFQLDLREHLLLRSGQPVAINPKTFSVLAALVTRGGNLVTKQELFSEVWPDAIVEDTNLSQKVYQLRKLLSDGSDGEEYIQNVPRLGYRFVAPVRIVQPRSSGAAQEATAVDANDLTQSISRPKRYPKHWPAAIFVGLLLIVGCWAWRHYRTGQVADSPKKIAVLPFRQVGAEAVNDTLGLGVADALIGRLSVLSGSNQVKVLPTDAVARFAGQNLDHAAVGHALGVDAILDGTIQRSTDRIRVTAELTNLSDNRVLWSAQYETKITDIFELQDAISIHLAEMLKPQLTEPQRQLLTKRETRNVDAYQSYVTGLYFSQLFSDAATAKAIKYFQQAIETDSSYARAYAALARCYSRAVHNFEDIAAPEDALRLSAEAAKRALELDPNLADAHVAMGDVFYFNDQLDEADREYQLALQLEPNSSMFHMKYGLISFASLRLDKAVQHLKLAQELDPPSPVINSTLGLMLVMQRDYENAGKYCQRAVELDPNNPLAALYLAYAYEQSGNYDLAIQQYRRAAGNFHRLSAAGIAHAQALAGRRDEARKIARQIELSKSSDPRDTYNLVAIHVALGDNAKAVQQLEKASLSPLVVAFLKYDPQLDSLRSDPRFADFLHTHGLDQRFERAGE